MEDDRVPVEVLDEAHVADARVVDPQHLGSGRPNLLDRRRDVGHAECEPAGVRDELLAVAKSLGYGVIAIVALLLIAYVLRLYWSGNNPH